MKPRWFNAIACLAILLTAPCSGWAQSSSTMQAGFDAMLEVERTLSPDADPTPPLKEVFASHFGDVPLEAIGDLADADLKAYFGASSYLTFFSSDPGDMVLMESAFSAMESRGLATPFDVKSMFKAYVALRDFDHARALAARHPGVELEALPGFSGLEAGFEEPTVLELRDDGIVSRVAAGVPILGPYVVVAAHPLCHFSENAVRAIRQDPVVASLFHGRTLWLMPQDGALNLDVVRDWNREFPDYSMKWAYRTSDWPMIKRWATPNFYFYRDGKLVSTVVGWPEEGQRKELLAAFRSIGVAMPASAPDQPSR